MNMETKRPKVMLLAFIILGLAILSGLWAIPETLMHRERLLNTDAGKILRAHGAGMGNPIHGVIFGVGKMVLSLLGCLAAIALLACKRWGKTLIFWVAGLSILMGFVNVASIIAGSGQARSVASLIPLIPSLLWFLLPNLLYQGFLMWFFGRTSMRAAFNQVTERPKSTIPARVFWAIVGIGVALPWLIRIGTEAFFNPTKLAGILATFPSELFAPGVNLWMIGLLSGIPFLVVALLVKNSFSASGPSSIGGKAGAYGAGIGVLVLTLWMNLSIYVPLYGPGRASSTAAIGFVFLPVYGLAILPVGFVLGWLVGRFIRK